MLDGFESLTLGLKKTLLPSFFLLTLEYLGCLFLTPDVAVRMGVVFGFIVVDVTFVGQNAHSQRHKECFDVRWLAVA